MLRVVLSTNGRAHTFALARQLHKRGWLERIVTGYPRHKLQNEGIPADRIASYPWPIVAEMVLIKARFGGPRLSAQGAFWLRRCFESYIAAHLPPCDLYMGLSSTSLAAGRRARRRGAVYVCDRGCAHLRYQADLLTEEHARHGLAFKEILPQQLKREEQEYAEADVITVPSTFALRSFLEMGVPEHKLRRIPYGVELARFHPVAEPDPDRFTVLFVGSASLQKGTPYLLEAFARLRHPAKQLIFVGHIQPEVRPMIQMAMMEQSISCRPPVPQSQLKEIMSRSHVLVLPSIQDGMGMVMAEAMACGCPVIATLHTGALDLFEDGIEGFIVPIRSSEAIGERLQQIAEDPNLRSEMATAALQKVKGLGGWDHYGSEIADLFRTLTGK
jgi:glycosyltransferase involved in cell wall biosynthesis